jgi:hypothetical protein
VDYIKKKEDFYEESEEMSRISSGWIGQLINSRPEKKMVHGVKDSHKTRQSLRYKHKLTNK